VDLPGVNVQERTRDRLIESLRSGAQEMLETEVPFEAEAVMTTVEIPCRPGRLAQRSLHKNRGSLRRRWTPALLRPMPSARRAEVGHQVQRGARVDPALHGDEVGPWLRQKHASRASSTGTRAASFNKLLSVG
jgi:hypothetical protein